MIISKNRLAAAGVAAVLGLGPWAMSATNAHAEIAAVPEIAKLLPQELRDRGTIQVGATSTNMPAQFTNEAGELIGVAVELYKAAAQVLGVEAKFDVVTFDALQPGVESGRYDLATMGDTAEREKLFDIISLYSNGTAVVGHAKKAVALDPKKDLCGHSVGVTKGTVSNRNLTKISDENCVAEGKEPIEISTYVDNAGVALAVASEQDEYGTLEKIVALAYAARDPDVIKVVGDITVTTSGAGIKKGNDQFRDAFHAALRHLVETGVYEEVLKKYGIGDELLPELPINLAGSKK